MAATPEGKIKQKINEVLDRYKEYLYVFMPVPYGYGRSTLDYLGFVSGHGFAIEAKRPGEKPTPRQDIIIKYIERSNTPVFVIDGENGELEALEDWLALRCLEGTPHYRSEEAAHDLARRTG